MRNYKSNIFAILLGLLTMVSFTSCEDYEWRDGTMYYYSTITASGNGKITADLPIDYNWVNVDGPYNRIDDIRFYSGHIEIKTANYIDGFDLRLSNSDIVLPVDVRSYSGGILEGRQVNDFLNAVVEVVRRDGRATIYVDGWAGNLARFELNFILDIDAYVSY